MAEYCWVTEEMDKKRSQSPDAGLPVGSDLRQLLHEEWEPVTSVPSSREGEVFLLMRRE